MAELCFRLGESSTASGSSDLVGTVDRNYCHTVGTTFFVGTVMTPLYLPASFFSLLLTLFLLFPYASVWERTSA